MKNKIYYEFYIFESFNHIIINSQFLYIKIDNYYYLFISNINKFKNYEFDSIVFFPYIFLYLIAILVKLFSSSSL